MDFVYVMEECGCRLTADELGTWIGRTENGGATRRRICPTHGTRISHRITNCAVCGIELRQHESGQIMVRCEPCKTKIRKEKNRISAYKYRHALNGIAGAEDMENPDCPMFQNVCKACIEPTFSCAMRPRARQQVAA